MKNLKLILMIATVAAFLAFTARTAAVHGLYAAWLIMFLGAAVLGSFRTAPRLCTNDISLTGLTEIIYKARDQVVREGTGFIQGCLINSDPNGVSQGGTVSSIRTSAPTLNTSYTPAMTVPSAADVTTTTESMTLGQVANVQIPLKGEQIRQLGNTAGEEAIQNIIAQSIRVMVNAIEARIGVVAKNGASRAIGTAGTTPFASNVNTIAQLRQILFDNGCPVDDGQLNLIINSLAGTNLRNVANLYKVNEAGSDATLRRGELLNLHGFSIRESAGVASHTKGTGASYAVDLLAGYAIGDRTIHIDTGTGTIVAGDMLAFQSDTNVYGVYSGFAGDGDGDITLNHPGLRAALANDKTVTVGNNYTGNVGFHRTAIELAMRPIALPPGGDVGEHMTMLDDKTGLTFDVALYRGRGMNMIEMTTVYEAKVWKPEFVAALLG